MELVSILQLHFALMCPMHVFVYLGSVIHFDGERSGSEVARVFDPRQRD